MNSNYRAMRIFFLALSFIAALHAVCFAAKGKLEVYYNQKNISAYKNAIVYFNPALDRGDAERIAKCILYYSWLQDIEDPRLVVALVAAESRFRPWAVSRSGAQGLGQLSPGTAKELGVDNAFEPMANIWGCISYLKRMIAKFSFLPRQQRYEYAIAAYNAGPGAVDTYGGVPPYRETVNYVRVVINYWRQLSGMKAQ